MNQRHLLRGLTLLAFLIIAGASAMAQGKVEIVGGDRYDWGKVAAGELKATIVVKNAGTGVLNISHVQPSCGCTSSPIDKSMLQPGETGSISVTLHANRAGTLAKSLTVYSDAPGDTAHLIQLVGEVENRPAVGQVSEIRTEK